MNESRAYYSEWRKSKKNKYHVLKHIYGIEKKWYWRTYLQGKNRDGDMKNRPVDPVGRGEGVINWESSIEICTLPYVKQIANGKLLYNTGSSAGVLWQLRWAGGGREVHREETRVFLWLTHTVVSQKQRQQCKAIIFQLKKKKEKNYIIGDFSGCPVAQMPCSQCQEPRFDPQSGN